jgi:hypothetical protein
MEDARKMVLVLSEVEGRGKSGWASFIRKSPTLALRAGDGYK